MPPLLRAVILLTLLAVVQAGCTTTTTAPPDAAGDPLAAVPDDFTLDLRVLTPQQRVGEDAAQTVTPGRFVLLPDGSLHAELDGLHKARRLPPFVRRLDARQRAELWSAVAALGYADADQADPTVNPLRVDRPVSGALYVLTIRGRQRQWMFLRRITPDQREPAMAQLTGTLAELAWLDDGADGVRMIAPRRYDFGPDPYAPYRTGGSGGAAP